MNRESFYDQLKFGEILPCYLFEGEEEYTKASALKLLQSKVLQGDMALLNASVLLDPDADELIAVAETLPLMADKRFVLVKDSAWFSGRAGKEGTEDEEKPAAKADSGADKVADYLTRLPKTLCLVFYTRGKANGTRKLYKQIAKMGGLVAFENLDQAMIVKWIAKELKGYGKQIDHQTAEQLLFAVGDEMYQLSQELSKLAACAGERQTISIEDIEAISVKTREYKVFDLSDAVVSGQANRAARLMRDMIMEGEQRLMLIALLQRQYRQLLFTKILIDQGLSADGIAKKLAVPPFVARKLQGLSRNYTIGRLKWAYDMLIDTEFAVKSGQIAEEGSLEQALYRLLGEQREEHQHA